MKKEIIKKEVKKVLNEWGYTEIGGIPHLLNHTKETYSCVNLEGIYDIKSLMQTMYRLGQKDKINQIKNALDIK